MALSRSIATQLPAITYYALCKPVNKPRRDENRYMITRRGLHMDLTKVPPSLISRLSSQPLTERPALSLASNVYLEHSVPWGPS